MHLPPRRHATRPGNGRPTARAHSTYRRWPPMQAPRRGTRVVLHLMDDAKIYAERATVEPLDQGAIRPCAGADRDRGEARRRRRPRSPTAPRLWTKPKAEITRGRLHRFLPQHRRRLRRAGADHPFSRRGPAGLYGAVVRSRLAAVRSVRSRPHGPHQALRQARLHHRRCRYPAALSALRARPRRLRRPAAQRLARENPGEPASRRDQEGRDRPRAVRARAARRQGAGRLTPKSGTRSARCSRKASTRISSAATRC